MSDPLPHFVVATPSRSVCDKQAQVLDELGLLRLYCLGARRGTAGIPSAKTRLLPAYGLLNYASARLVGSWKAEPFRCRLYPYYDAWVKAQLQPGDSIISSYGYANASFRWVREHGGKTYLDGGNSHPQNFWDILTEEHARWGVKAPPISRFHFERSLAMMEDVDYVLSPSSFVSDSFLSRGFKAEQIIPIVYPVDLACFSPKSKPEIVSGHPRNTAGQAGVKSNIRNRPLTLINTGSLSLRKGTPYLLEAYRLIRKEIPDARLLLIDSISESMVPLMKRYADLPIEWSPPLPHPQLAERLRSADIFILPSLEEGFARTVAEALSTGLPVVVTPNTGFSNLIQSGLNGTLVPLRDPNAIATAAFYWWSKIKGNKISHTPPVDINKLTMPELKLRLSSALL